MESFVECDDGSVARRTYICNPDDIIGTGSAASGFIVSIHITDTTPNTESSFAIPAATKRYCIRNRSNATIQISDSSGFSGVYFSLDGGNTIDSGSLDGTTQTVYTKSEKASQTLEILLWS